MRAFLPLILLALLLFPPAHAYAGGKRLPVTVMPFVALSGDNEAWLGKALSDMVARKLAESGNFDVLERDKLQAFIKEMELQQAGFTDGDVLQRIGGLAKVESVVYGNYAIDGNSITLNLLEMNVKDQKILYRAETKGSADGLQQAADTVVVEYLKARGGPARGAELQNIEFHPTDSTSAVKHFYNGLDLYDNGKYEDAYGHFLAAEKQDAKYLDARLWAARMLEYTGQAEQAVLAYKKLYDDAPAAVEGRDALVFAARILEASDPDKSAAYYKTITDILPKIPESLEAAYRLGIVLEKQGHYADAYLSLLSIQDFREEADKLMSRIASEEQAEERNDFFGVLHSLVRLMDRNKRNLTEENEDLASGLADLTMRQSRFFDWDDALSLYRGTVLQMVGLYRKAQKEAPDLKPPRGTFAVDPQNPVITEAHYGDTKSLFFKDVKIYPQWSENFYAAVIPEGYTATGVTLHVSGRVPQPTNTTDFTFRVFGFPLVRNYFNNWLGVIYGQTQQMTTLQKEIPFHGRNRDILVFQLIENHSEIRDWQVEFRLRKTEGDEKPAPQVVSSQDFEGKEIARLPLNEDAASGVADPQYIEQYGTKKRLSVSAIDGKGGLLVAAKGSLTAGETDLWASHSTDGKTWQPLSRLSVNSQSNDFAPQVVRSEDGGARLFWISNRRGLGWEIWTSKLGKGLESWSQPLRIPVGKLMGQTSFSSSAGADDMPEFSAIQDHNGRWLVAVCSRDIQGVSVFSSTDGEKWETAASVADAGRMFDPAFFQDATDTYWLGALDGGATFHLLKSFDLKKWDVKKYGLGSYSRHWSDGGNANYGSVAQVAGFPIQMFDGGDGRLALLFSDTMTGLQYARFRPDSEEPQPDLVRNVTLEPYAAAKFSKDEWLVSAWQGDDIVLRRYKGFAFPDNEKNPASDPLYHETELDANGNRWDRRIARTRYVMPDVTAVGASPDGRAWWGIETGVMALKGDDFFVSDVSMGFFFHQVTDIVPCGDKTYFSSHSLDEPVIGVIANGWMTNKTEKIALPELSGAVTAIACGTDGNIFVGTSGGDIAAVAGSGLLYKHHIDKSHLSAIAADGQGAWAGTKEGTLYHMTEHELRGEGFQKELGAVAVTGVAVAAGNLWVATEAGGLRRKDASGWKQFTPLDSPFPYFTPGKIKAQGKGIWFMPDAYTLSKGIGFFDGEIMELYNPPSHNIFDMIDFDIAADGGIWVGSESSGIYRLERKR